MTTLKFHEGIHWNTLEGINHIPEARGKSDRLSASAHRALAASLAAALTVFVIQPSKAAEPGLVKIAVFDFELDDRSAGGGIIGQDAIDTENLKMSREEARRMLSASGRYNIVDAGSVAGELISAGGIQHCNGCEGSLAKKLGRVLSANVAHSDRGRYSSAPLFAGQPHGHPSYYSTSRAPPSCQACEAADCPGVCREADQVFDCRASGGLTAC